MCSAFRSCFDVYLLVPSLRVGIRIFLLDLENACRPDRPVAPSTEVDVACANVDVVRSVEARRVKLTDVVSLNNRFSFFHGRSVGDGQHYRTILIADPPYVFP